MFSWQRFFRIDCWGLFFCLRSSSSTFSTFLFIDISFNSISWVLCVIIGNSCIDIGYESIDCSVFVSISISNRLVRCSLVGTVFSRSILVHNRLIVPSAYRYRFPIDWFVTVLWETVCWPVVLLGSGYLSIYVHYRLLYRFLMVIDFEWEFIKYRSGLPTE